MGYYAEGSGGMRLNVSPGDPMISKIVDILSEEFDAYATSIKRDGVAEAYIEISGGDKYFELSVVRVLEEAAATGAVESGEIDYIGEDREMWRFIYDRDTRVWVEESGTVLYRFPNSPLLQSSEMSGYMPIRYEDLTEDAKKRYLEAAGIVDPMQITWEKDGQIGLVLFPE